MKKIQIEFFSRTMLFGGESGAGSLFEERLTRCKKQTLGVRVAGAYLTQVGK